MRATLGDNGDTVDERCVGQGRHGRSKVGTVATNDISRVSAWLCELEGNSEARSIVVEGHRATMQPRDGDVLEE